MKMIKSPGMICLAAYLILVGLIPLLNISLGMLSPIVSILAIAAGVLILLGK